MRRQTSSTSKLWVVALLVAAVLSTVLANSASAGVQSIRGIDSFDGTEAWGPSMVLDADDNPVIAYIDADTNQLKILHCNDPSCDGVGDTINIEATLNDPRGDPSLALTSEGFPVVAFADDGEIAVLRCNDTACNGSDSLEFVAVDAIGFAELALTTDDHPVIGYVDDNAELQIVVCTNTNCRQRFAPVAPVGGQELSTIPSLRLDPLNRPVIAYTLAETGHLQLVRCSTTTCDGGVSTTRQNNPHVTSDLELVPTGNGGYVLFLGTVMLPPGGFEQGFGDSVVYTCFNVACTELTTVEAPTLSGYRHPYYPDFALGPNGFVLAVSDLDQSEQVLVASMDPAVEPTEFTNRRTLIMAPDFAARGLQNPSLKIDGDGNAAIATVTDGGIRVIRCNDSGCIPTCNGQQVTVDIAALQAPPEGVDALYVGEREVVRGTPDRDIIRGGNVICGLGGDDDITSGGSATIFGGAGNDVIRTDNGSNFVSGGPGNDTIIGSATRDRLFGGPGRDIIDGRGGVDRISGGDGNDTLFGGSGDDKMFGNLGRDTIEGGPGNDIIKGGAWIDTVDGGDGDDDRCGIVEGEIRINCERGVFGI